MTILYPFLPNLHTLTGMGARSLRINFIDIFVTGLFLKSRFSFMRIFTYEGAIGVTAYKDFK